MQGRHLTAIEARQLFRYDPSTGVLYRRHASGERVGAAKSNGYLVVSVRAKNYQVHRLIWLMVHGKWPDGDIDHINRIKTDNRITNLRDVSHQANMRNIARAKKLALVGPVPDGGKWSVILPHYLGERREGPFDSHAEAHAFYAEHVNMAESTEGRERPRVIKPVV